MAVQYTKHFGLVQYFYTHSYTALAAVHTSHYSTVHFHNNKCISSFMYNTVDGNFYGLQGKLPPSQWYWTTCTVYMQLHSTALWFTVYIYIYILFSRVLLIVTQCGIKHAHFTVLYDVFTLNHTVGMIWSYFQNWPAHTLQLKLICSTAHFEIPFTIIYIYIYI